MQKYECRFWRRGRREVVGIGVAAGGGVLFVGCGVKVGDHVEIDWVWGYSKERND